MSIKLTDRQLVMLSAAAQREDRSLTPPENLKGAALHKVAAKLIAAGIVKEIQAKVGTPVWRRDKQNGQSYALKLTAAGAKAIAVDLADDATPAGDEERPGMDVDRPAQPDLAAAGAVNAPSADALATPRAPRVGTKLAQAIEMLQANEGATIDELSEAMGWLPHTTRAVLTGLRKRGYALTLDRSRLGSKAAKIIDLLQRATLDELIAATGRLPHTTRAALTGLRKRGYEKTRGHLGGVTRYRIESIDCASDGLNSDAKEWDASPPVRDGSAA